MPRTRVLPVDPEAPDPAILDEAAAILRAGGLVAFATETVYGLGADATNPEAVARIFAAKGRPSFNPLIVHADDLPMARGCVASWPEPASTLAARFWPGPLSLVLPRSPAIPDVVTGGRDTVGVRIPLPELTRGLIARTGRPLAAPSANRSLGVSPTLASHVLDDLDGRIDLVLDSGPTTVGLESAVVDLTSDPPRILRPGPITARELQSALGGHPVEEAAGVPESDAPASPGQLAIHYAPRTEAVRVEDAEALARYAGAESSALVAIGPHPLRDLGGFAYRFVLESPAEAARELYRVLRRCDDLGLVRIVVLAPPDLPEWRAVRDRLWRATKPSRSGG